MISFCHVDNYCHGLILGAAALYPGSPALGKWSALLIWKQIFSFDGFYDVNSTLCCSKSYLPFLPAIPSRKGKYYVITDGPPQYFWRVLDEAVVAMGFTSLFSKFHIPGWLIMGLAYIVVFLGEIFSAITGRQQCRIAYCTHISSCFEWKVLSTPAYIEYLIILNLHSIVHGASSHPLCVFFSQALLRMLSTSR